MNDKVVIITAVWCPSCLILKKNLKKLNEEYKLELETLDYDFDEEEVSKYAVGDKLPVIITKNNRLVGEKSYEEIVEFLKGENII